MRMGGLTNSCRNGALLQSFPLMSLNSDVSWFLVWLRRKEVLHL